MHRSPASVPHPPAIQRTGFRWSACLALGVLLFAAAYASGDTGEGEPDLATAYQPDPATMEQVRAAASDPAVRARGEAVLALDPESRVREVYRNYAEKVRASGHDLTFELSNFQTILAERYAEHRWRDLITLNVGSRLELTSGGADAPWLEEPIIFFEPSWEEFNEGSQEAADWRRQVLEGRSVLEVMGLLIDEGEFRAVPPAITTYRVRLRFENHHRTYQASVIWVEGAEGQVHEPYYFDDIVSRLTDIDDQGRRIVTPEGWEELYGSPMRPESGTPILLDPGRGGLDLTDAGGGVDFDLDADGIVERISWTTAGSADAFLVLDRDGNGGIDHGGELFGDATPQPEPGKGGQRHGFLALAVFDTAAEGGDGDGSITAADAVFDRLELWRDADHDGIADAGELTSLAEAGVVSLGLDYVENRSRDRHGNELRYRGHCQWVGPAGNAHTKPMIDVIFVQQ